MEPQMIYLPVDLRREIKAKAAFMGKSITEFSQEAFSFYLTYLKQKTSPNSSVV